ncbi:phytoene desaturase [Salinibacter altiplanensis]|uniref:phytoene desaturase n=1 Tax=Salinibacter altiplanensis TaxID=1803181 RepID=UPI000C9F29BA|nr:phytoene desaturase [Salinibacter altiplanensis]
MSWLTRLAHRDDASLNTRATPRPAGPDAPHAVVVGAGVGGLASAIRLRTRGFRVTLLDRLDQPGGRARVFEQDGFTFDAGPTVITAPFLFEELWSLCGRDLEDDVELVPVDPFYRIRFDDGTAFNYTGDTEDMVEEIARFAPEDVDGYRRFLEKSEEIFEVGFEELGHVPFDNVTDMLRIVPAMMKLQSHRTVHSLVSKYISHPKIRKVLSFHPLLVGGNPFSTTSIYTLIAHLERKWGVWYAMGGTGSLVQGMADLLADLGVTQRYGAEVDQILVENETASGVRLSSGETLGADLVVSNADVGWTYRHLVAPEHRDTWTDRKVENMDYSMSLFVWYFGTDRTYEDVEHHSILLGPRYKGLLDDIFDHKELADDFSLYLHRPTKTDPSMAPDGHDAFYVLSPVPHLDSGVDWRQQAEPYRQAVEDYLADTVLPDLGEHLVTSRMLTPREFKTDYKSLKGAAFSVEPKLTQSAWFRPHNQSEDVEHLYFAGAGTHPGAGLPGVLSSARVLDTIVPAPEAFGASVSQNGAGARAEPVA